MRGRVGVNRAGQREMEVSISELLEKKQLNVSNARENGSE